MQTTKHSFFILSFALGVLVSILGGSAIGYCQSQNQPTSQNQPVLEFIESSSPSKNGGRVTSRFVPGSQIQTRVEQQVGAPVAVAANPFNQNQTAARQAFSSQATGSGTRQSSFGQTATGQQRDPGPTVGFAPDARPNLSQRPTQSALVAQNCNCNCNCAPQCVCQPRGATASTLQLPALRTPQSQLPQQVLSQSLTNPVQVQSPAQATQAPQLNFPNVTAGQSQLQFPQPPIGSSQGFFQSPNLGVPQLSGSTFGSRLANWWRPLAGGTGAYVPVVRLQNMPPGVYLGQGIIGQPTAYADGQPIRNLLRYISP